MAQNDGTINLTPDDLNPDGVNDQNAVPGTIDISRDIQQGPTAPQAPQAAPKQIQGQQQNLNKIKFPTIVSPTPTVPMFSPDGSLGDIPAERVHDAVAKGGIIASPIIAPDGTHGAVPSTRLHEALKAGAKIDASGWSPDQLNAHPTVAQRVGRVVAGPGTIGADVADQWQAATPKGDLNAPYQSTGQVSAPSVITPLDVHTEMSKGLGNPLTPEEKEQHPFLARGIDFAGSMASPENFAIMVGSGGLGKLPGPAGEIIGKALSAGFGIPAVYTAIKTAPTFMDALAKGDEVGAKEALMDVVLNIAAGEQSAEHLTGLHPTLGNVGVAAETSADALGHAVGEYGGKVLDAAKNIPGAGLVKGTAKLVAGAVAQPYNAMTEGPEAKITRAAGGSAGVQERDFQENIPRALKYIVDENKTNKISTPEDMAEAAHTQKTKLWQETLGKPHPGETIDGNKVADQIVSGINKSTAQHFPEVADAITKWADTFRGPYNLDDAMSAIMDFNAKLRQFYKQSPSDQFRMAQADPKLGMLQDAADALRNVAFDKLEKELGEKNIPELRKDYGALNQMQRIFEKRAVVYGRQAPIDLKSSLGGIAAFATGHPLAAAVPFITKYLNSPEHLIESAISKAGKTAETPKSAKPLVEQPNRPVSEIRPPGVEPKTPAGKPVTETSPAGSTPTSPGQQKTAGGAAVNPTEATAEPGPDGKLNLEARKSKETGKQQKITKAGWLSADGRFHELGGDVGFEHGEAAVKLGLTDEENTFSKDGDEIKSRAVYSALENGHVRVIGGESNPEYEAGRNNDETRRLIANNLRDNPQASNVTVEFNSPRSLLRNVAVDDAINWLENGARQRGLQLEARRQERIEEQPPAKNYVAPTEPRIDAPANRRPSGYLPGDEHVHEWGHVTNAALEGWGTEGIKSHLATDLPSKRTTAAATVIPRGIDWKDPDSVARNSGKILSVVLGGAVANELHSQIPYEINQGIQPDVNLVKNVLQKELGFTDDEIDAAIRYGRDRAARNLTQPGISDIMLENSKVRESGLSPTMHASPERTEAYAQEVRRIQDANRKPAGEGSDQNRANPEAEGLNRQDDAGTKSPIKAGTAASLESRQEKVDKVSGRLSKKYDVTKDVEPGDETARFIMNDGNVIRDTENDKTRHYGVAATGLGKDFTYENADEMAEKGENLVSEFMAKTGSVRVQPEYSDAVGFHVNGRPSAQQLQSMAKLAKGLTVIYDLPGKSGEGSFGDFQRELDKAYPKTELESNRGLKEKTTGDDEADQHIRTAGAIPAGSMMNLALFHDHETGSTLALDKREVTPERVQQQLDESREKFGVKAGVDLETGKEDDKEHPTVQALKEKFGKTTNPEAMLTGGASFLHDDGTVTNIGSMTHPDAIATATGNAKGAADVDRTGFINDTGSIRVRNRRMGKAGPELIFSVPEKGVTEDQVSMMRQAVGKMGRNGNLLIEAAHEGNEPSDTAHSWPENNVKEFASPRDVEPMLREIGAHPDQTKDLPPMLRGKAAPEPTEPTETKTPNLNAYHAEKGIAPAQPIEVPVDKQQGAKIADAYDEMKHDPTDPAVKASYDALKRDTVEQWKALEKQGVKMTVTDDPDYYKNAQEMLQDIKDNKHIAVWSGEGVMPTDHPMRDIEPSTGLTYNTLFRGVHDVLGHGVGANDFSEQGEENAYNLHRQSYSPEAIPALATETKGQANWVFNNKALRESGGEPSQFPTQKAALLPEEFHGADPWAYKAAELEKDGGFTVDPRNGEVPKSGYQVEAAPDVRVDLDHTATPADIQKFYNDNKQLFDKHPEMKVGGYGKELNASASTDSRAAAEALAKKLDQYSIWDVKNGKEILTGGEGKQTSFPDYPIEQRMADLRGNKKLQLESSVAEAEPETETGDTTFNFGANAAEPTVQSKPYDAETSQRVSSRFPTADSATEDPMQHQLTLEHDLIHNNPAVAQRLADKIVRQNKSMVFTPEEKAQGAKGIFDSFIRQAKDNIKAVYERSRESGNHVSDRIWYDGAHDFTKRDAEANGLTHAQAAGVLATQSPQKDWDANVSMYNRIEDIVKNKGDIKTTPQMEKKGAEFVRQINASNRKKIAAGKKPADPWVERKILNSFKDKTLNDITNPAMKAAWLRLYDEAHNDRGFNEMNPDGTVVGPRKTMFGAPEKVAWGGLDSISKAIKIMQDGSLESISKNLGENHKVRSFYNNIIEPNSPHQDVTADTHHVGLSLMRPVAGSDPETRLNFSGNKSIVSGVRGTYPLYVEATRQAMQEINQEHPDEPPLEYPRQLQSVIWVEWRKMFPPDTRTATTKAAVDSIWKEHLDGQITADEARTKISDYAQRLRSGVDEGEQRPADEGKLPAHQLPGAGDSGRSRGGSPGQLEVQTRPAGSSGSRSLKPSSDKPVSQKKINAAEGFREMMRRQAGTKAGQSALGEK